VGKRKNEEETDLIINFMEVKSSGELRRGGFLSEEKGETKERERKRGPRVSSPLRGVWEKMHATAIIGEMETRKGGTGYSKA